MGHPTNPSPEWNAYWDAKEAADMAQRKLTRLAMRLA